MNSLDSAPSFDDSHMIIDHTPKTAGRRTGALSALLPFNTLHSPLPRPDIY